jgi:serine/threonine-protein kinase
LRNGLALGENSADGALGLAVSENLAAPSALTPELQSAFELELAETNRRRLLALTPLVATMHALHIAWFYTPVAKRPLTDPRVLIWHDGIVLAHLCTLVPALLLGVYLFVGGRKPAPAWPGVFAATLYLLHGAVVAAIDQLAVTAVTPFLAYALGLIVVLALTPRAAVFAYGVGLCAFVAGIAIMQQSASARGAILPNGFSTVAVSIAATVLLYGARRRDFAQRLTIEEQRKALTQLNLGLERRVEEQVSEIVARAKEVELLNAQLQTQVRERSTELAKALAKLAERRRDDGKLRRGVVLGERFEIEGLLGEGGMGVVYQALDRHSGARVAIKVVQAVTSQIDAVQRFLREARAAAAITHPGVVRMLQVDVTDDGTLFQAQELVAGDDLELRVRRGTCWDPCVVARLCATLFDALAAAHARGIVHRDVKPGNVMITRAEPGLKLLDFGISKLYEDALGDSGATRTGTILGTPAYMPPEQLVASSEASDRVDVYAAGVIAFQLLTGRFPFELERAVANDPLGQLGAPAPNARELEPNVPAELAELVAACLATRPEARPAAAEMALRLSAFADQRKTPALPELERSGLVFDLEQTRALSAPTLAGPSSRPA